MIIMENNHTFNKVNNTQKLQIFELNVLSNKSIKDFHKALKGQRIDIFINNAGAYGPKNLKIGNICEDEWAKVLKVNSISPMILTQLLIQNMQHSHLKKLINIRAACIYF